MLKTRFLSALVLLSILSVTLYFGGVLLQAMAFLVAVAINFEYFSFATKLSRSRVIALTALSSILSLSVFMNFDLLVVLVCITVLVFILSVLDIELGVDQLEFHEVIPAVMCGFLYTGLLGLVLVKVTQHPHANIAFVWLFSVAIASDSFAYFGGRLIGGPKIAPRLSPNKTVSGSVVGLLMAVIASMLSTHYFELEFTMLMSAGLGLLAAFLVQTGDLIESMFKRIYDVKDSGNLIPGHGGVLDRVDGLIFAAPLLLFLL